MFVVEARVLLVDFHFSLNLSFVYPPVLIFPLYFYGLSAARNSLVNEFKSHLLTLAAVYREARE